MVERYKQTAASVTSRTMRKHILRTSGDVTRSDGIHSRLAEGFSDAQKYDIDNVVHWIRGMDKGAAEYGAMLSSMPNCVPPYPFTYLEWKGPGGKLSAFITCGRHSTRDGWVAEIMVFAHHDGKPNATFVGSMYVSFDEAGRIISAKPSNTVLYPDSPAVELELSPDIQDWLLGQEDVEARRGEIDGILSNSAFVVLFAFALMGCKNVHHVEVDERAKLNRQQIRAREREKQPFITYKILEVKPLRSMKTSAAEPDNEEDGRITRMHWVAGHFAEYGPEYGKGLLFGRIAGRFFIDPHVRGDLDEGFITKDYKLAAPPRKAAAAPRSASASAAP